MPIRRKWPSIREYSETASGRSIPCITWIWCLNVSHLSKVPVPFGNGVPTGMATTKSCFTRCVGATARRGARESLSASYSFIGAIHRIGSRSEEHTSELQSQSNLVCRLLLEKKKKKKNYNTTANGA